MFSTGPTFVAVVPKEMRRAARRRVRGREDGDKGDVDVAARLTGGESGIGEETGMREGDAGVRCG